MKRLGLLGITLIITLASFGQDTKRYMKLANTDFNKAYYRLAALNYERVLSKEPEDTYVIYRLGICYLHTYSVKKGLEFLQKAYEKDQEVDKHLHYWLGRGYHLNYKFGDASTHYNQYLETLGKRDSRRVSITKHIEECRHGERYMDDPKNYAIINAGPVLNTQYSEHSPVITQDGSKIFFTSEQYVDTEEEADRVGQLYEDIYVAERDNKGEWGAPVPFMRNTDEQDATVQLFDNDRKLLIYRNTGGGDLYFTEVDDEDHWSNLEKFESVNSPWSEVDAYVNKEENMMVFASSREDHGEDMDLYVTRKEGEHWGEPEKLPNHINTQYDENSPFISADGKYLFFSSNGHATMGGYDVFRCEIDLEFGTWGEPENMGYPLNTPGDDIYFYYNNDNSWSGYFSSYREGGFGEKDLYHVTFIPNVFVAGKVTDFENEMPVPGLRVEFVSEKNGEIMDATLTSAPEGEYRVNILADDRYSVKVFDENDNVISSAHYEIGKLASTDPLEYRFDLKVDLSEEEPLMAEAQGGVQFNEDMMDAAPGDVESPSGEESFTEDTPIAFEEEVVKEEEELGSTSDINPAFEETEPEVVAVTSHEPSVVSERPAEEPVNDVEETVPVRSSEVASRDASTDMEELSPEEQERFFQNASEASEKWQGTHQEPVVQDQVAFAKADSPGFQPKEEKQDPQEYFEMKELKTGCSGVLSNVYFDFNRATLKSGSFPELDQLACLMSQNPDIKVEIGGHTDDIGGANYNEKLSYKRASAVVKYLVRKGVQNNRLVAVGYGEKSPLATNDDELEGRELNRRTEFKIIDTGVAFANLR